jgi:hypothetical protein
MATTNNYYKIKHGLEAPSQDAIQVTESTRPTIRPSLSLDFANSKVLDPRITFARASTATYYDGKTVAKAEENLVTYSQEFDNGAWSKLDGDSSITSGFVAPDNTLTSQKLVATNTNAVQKILRRTITLPNQKLFSIYAKAAELSYLQIDFTDVPTVFNLATGVVVSGGGSIVNVGNGWYRCIYTVNKVDSFVDIQLHNGTTASFSSNIGDGVYLWGAQLEQRDTVTAYTPTTAQPITNYIPVLQTADANVARFDHNPVTGESLGLLIEEQRTNLATYSEDFSNAFWTNANSTVTANTIVAPDGTLTGDKLITNTISAEHSLTYNVNVVSGTSYTQSFFAKLAEKSFLFINWNTTYFGSPAPSYFNLTTGVATAGAGVTTTMTAVGNDWYKCSATKAATTTGLATLRVGLTDSNTSTNTTGANTFDGIYIWGAQLEAGSFPTSYIPTVASQVTRSADSASMTGSNFSSWYRADEGTVYAEAVRIGASGASTNPSRVFTMQDSSGIATNQLSLGNIVSPRTNDNVYIQNLPNTLNASLGVLSGNNVTFKVCLAVDANGIYASKNGALTQTTLGTINQGYKLTRLVLGNVVGASQCLNGTIKKLSYYPQRLSNEQLQGLTSS